MAVELAWFRHTSQAAPHQQLDAVGSAGCSLTRDKFSWRKVKPPTVFTIGGFCIGA